MGDDAMTGTIKTLRSEKGFGFIRCEDKEYFFHHTGVESGSFDDFREGDTVDFDVVDSPKGPRAERVRKK
jgi:CspA family cold shock protein